jgi:8-oxo-dGTP pyrophosphatase MutT (NUDIX family)
MTGAAARLLALQRRLLARADLPPPAQWVTVHMAGHAIGTTSPEVARFLAAREARCRLDDDGLEFVARGLDFRARCALLADAAHRLRDAGLLHGWRDELLDVRPLAGGPPLATVERAACRALGIATHAVHMNGFAADGRLYVARRAEDKPVDPGLWDNLVGGMVTAGESELAALAREAKEEAGLDLARLAPVRGGFVRERRPVREGYMVESVQVFDAVLPADCTPRNEDGEVAAIELRDIPAVLAAIERDEFTLEAALVTVDALLRRAQP